MPAENIVTPEFRGHFVAVFKPTPKPAPSTEKQHSVKAVFAPGADMTKLYAQCKLVMTERFGVDETKWPKVRKPFRKNRQEDGLLVDGEPDDAIIMTFSSKEERKPGIVDARNNDIIDEAQVYSGAYYRCQVRAFYYDTGGNKGVSFGLQNVQKIRDGEPTGGRVPANKAFDAIETGDVGGDASSIFD